MNTEELSQILDPFFNNTDDLDKFVRKCSKKIFIKRTLNRVGWFVELADYQKEDSVRVFFLIAMAETNIKLLDKRFYDDQHMTKDLEDFFGSFSKTDKDILKEKFVVYGKYGIRKKIRLETVISILSNVRHNLVHGKDHYTFTFHHAINKLSNIVSGQIGKIGKKRKIQYELTLTYNEFRHLMIKYAIENIKKKL